MKLFLLETFLLTVILPCLVTVELYCPTGKTFHALPRHAMREFERHCQCRGGALCRYNTHSLGCSSFLGDFLEKRYRHVKVRRSILRSHVEYFNVLFLSLLVLYTISAMGLWSLGDLAKTVTRSSDITWSSCVVQVRQWSALNIKTDVFLYLEFKVDKGTCLEIIDIAYSTVSYYGQSYLTPNPEPGCHTQITSPCGRPRWSFSPSTSPIFFCVRPCTF